MADKKEAERFGLEEKEKKRQFELKVKEMEFHRKTNRILSD